MQVVVDAASGRYCAELFWPGDAKEPIARTKPVYSTAEEAQRRVEENVLAAFSEQLDVPDFNRLVFESG